ncbi:serine/threonine-protein kinase pim-1-like [Myxocyprinus asiaticus]|uniref:serine/threonine-protein kinase pim-1-like n=1 Tax=Myxocyprinus asiaticus TaxID=70543 RepID=UPI0022218703|nr:serine/threonine-protein kinase pim-1-like [Myxocyprinus asiaticus]
MQLCSFTLSKFSPQVHGFKDTSTFLPTDFRRKTSDLYLSHSSPLPLDFSIIQALGLYNTVVYCFTTNTSEDLSEFVERHGGKQLARLVMRPATLAAQICCRCEVLHRDIKLENLLVNKDNLEVKLIDFGCGDILRKSANKEFYGTEEYYTSEFNMKSKYQGMPATVWSLGMLLFTLGCGHYPECFDRTLINLHRWCIPGVTA